MHSEIIVLVAFVIGLAIMAWLMIKRLNIISINQQSLDELRTDYQNLQLKLLASQNHGEYINRELERANAELSKLQQQNELEKERFQEIQVVNNQLLAEKLSLAAENNHLSSAYDKLDTMLIDLRKQMTHDFEQLKLLALNELEQKANQSLKDASKEGVVIPLQESFRDLLQKINDLAVETKIINHNSTELHKEARNLALALTKDSKKKGDFGELILTNILESVGLQEHVSYLEQLQIRHQEGKIIPDVVVNLPHNRAVVIDSKNIMQYYYQGVANGEDTRKIMLDAVRATLKNLSSKNYAEILENSLSKSVFAYVIMFIPNESLFSFILEEDQRMNGSLLREAYQQKIFLAGPSTLLVLLGIIKETWDSYQVEARAELILKLAQEIADKIQITIERIGELGNGIRKTTHQYNEIIKSLDNGTSSSMIGKLERLVNLSGVKGNKDKLASLEVIDNISLRLPASND
ncbi:MAG: DNA recombination protein RmuC [Proteobacteria bacterium]|nr:MAG: DNA recombination protein RmuC [Pseudomonadota bacterium]